MAALRVQQYPSFSVTQQEVSPQKAGQLPPSASHNSICTSTTVASEVSADARASIQGTGSRLVKPNSVSSLQSLSRRRSSAEKVRYLHMRQFLDAENFCNVNAERKRFFRRSYPLHVAAKKGLADIARTLLDAGADPFRTDSAGQTPEEVAERYNKGGSHEDVLAVFDDFHAQQEAEQDGDAY